MKPFIELQNAFSDVHSEFIESPAIQRVISGNIARAHYASSLRQIFHHTRENPQIQALATVYFRGPQRESIKKFFRHASSEIGHDQLALEDLKELGEPTDSLPFENPLPETSALLAFAFYQIQNLNPVGYLGYLFFLEFLPTGSGGLLMDALERAGIPRAAMRFLHDHSTIDVGHNRLMESYADQLIVSERELRSSVYAMRTTGRLYAHMLNAAFNEADAPRDWGRSTEESRELV